MNPSASQLRWSGLFLVAGLALVVVSVIFLLGSRLSRKTLPLECAVRGESVSGLTAGGKVLLRGIEIGRITSMDFDPKDPELILIGIEIDPEAPVYRDATATLEIFGITGLKYLELVPGSPAKGRISAGSVVGVRQSLTTSLLNSLDTIAKSSTRVLENLDQLTRKESRGRIDSILMDLQSTSGDFAAMAGQMREARLDSQLTRVSQQIQVTIHRIDSTIAGSRPDLAIARIDTAAVALTNVSKRADLMLGRSQGDIYRTLEDLRTTMRNLSDFSQSIRDNPSALIRSSGERSEK